LAVVPWLAASLPQLTHLRTRMSFNKGAEIHKLDLPKLTSLDLSCDDSTHHLDEKLFPLIRNALVALSGFVDNVGRVLDHLTALRSLHAHVAFETAAAMRQLLGLAGRTPPVTALTAYWGYRPVADKKQARAAIAAHQAALEYMFIPDVGIG
jgi:hypothetical protein